MSALLFSAPADLDSAITQLMAMLILNGQLQTFKEESLDNCAGIYHHSLGAHIRNEWGLWGSETALSKHLESLGIFHGDDKSSTIFRALWHRLNGRPFDVFKDVEIYRAHWAEYGLDMDGTPLQKKGRR